MIAAEELTALPTKERLQAMEILWQSFDQKQLDSPQWHQSALQETAQRVSQGKEQAVDWQEAKKLLSS